MLPVPSIWALNSAEIGLLPPFPLNWTEPPTVVGPVYVFTDPGANVTVPSERPAGPPISPIPLATISASPGLVLLARTRPAAAPSRVNGPCKVTTPLRLLTLHPAPIVID